MISPVASRRCQFPSRFSAGNSRWNCFPRLFESRRVAPAIRPARIVTLKPEGAIKCAVPVALNAGINGFSAGVLWMWILTLHRSGTGFAMEPVRVCIGAGGYLHESKHFCNRAASNKDAFSAAPKKVTNSSVRFLLFTDEETERDH